MKKKSIPKAPFVSEGLSLSDLIKVGPGITSTRKFAPPLPPGQRPAKIARGEPDPRNITGKRGGRPLGSKGKKFRHIKDMLAAADGAGVRALVAMITDEALHPETRLKAIALAWAYRWGKPTERRELTGANGEPLPSGAVQTGITFIAVHPTDGEGEFIGKMRALRGECTALPTPSGNGHDTTDASIAEKEEESGDPMDA